MSSVEENARRTLSNLKIGASMYTRGAVPEVWPCNDRKTAIIIELGFDPGYEKADDVVGRAVQATGLTLWDLFRLDGTVD